MEARGQCLKQRVVSESIEATRTRIFGSAVATDSGNRDIGRW